MYNIFHDTNNHHQYQTSNTSTRNIYYRNHHHHRFILHVITITCIILLSEFYHPPLKTNAFRCPSSRSTTTRFYYNNYNTKNTLYLQQQQHYHYHYRHHHHHRSSSRTLLHKMSSSSTTPPWMVSPIERNGKKVPHASIKSVIITTACIPVWAITVLPLSIIYQTTNIIAQQIQNLIAPNSSEHQSTAGTVFVLDSGYVVDPSTMIVPHKERTYDIVVLGVTGFTGYLAARHLIKTYGINGDKGVKWAIAGRSQTKLNDVKERLSKEFNPPIDVSLLETIVVDTSVPSTLPKLVSQTRVVATTAGPYTLYGNHVVEFCCKFGTHYVDITGEVDWIKAMICIWQTTAQQTGAKIIPFCGHDSIPWDVSAMMLQQKLLQEQNDVVESMTFYDEMVGGAPGGTFATVMTNIEGKSIKPPRVEFDPFLRLPDGSKSTDVCNANLSLFPKQSNPPQWDSGTTSSTSTSSFQSSKKWTTPFIMAVVNSQVVRWSYALRSKIGDTINDNDNSNVSANSNTMTYTESVLHTDLSTAYVTYVGTILFGTMLLNPITAYIMKHYLLPKPGDGPSMQHMENKHFLCVRGEAVGRSGSRAESIFYLNQDAGCLETSRMMIEAGLCLALQLDQLPSKGIAGFMSPAAGLGNVLLDRLIKAGAYFEYRSFPAQPKLKSKL